MADRIPCPRIVTHRSENCPKADQVWIAAFYPEAFTGTKKDNTWAATGFRRLPMAFFGATEVEASDRAVAWWETEQDKLEAAEAAKVARADARKKKDAA
jgi:hypothetical protein